MPEICRFLGIIITMYFDGHNPPHFHIRYNDYRAVMSIRELNILDGQLPAKVRGLVAEWAELHTQELLDMWDNRDNRGQTTVFLLDLGWFQSGGVAMPRRPRLVLPHVPLHLIQRGNNRQICFAAAQDYRFYRDWLKDYAGKTGCRIHAYVLMTNHVHLLLSADRSEAPGELMKALGQRYVQYYNRTYGRSGTLWEGRYRSCPTQAEDYLLSCQRYIELNPVRAGMVEHPADYRWSSYRANAQSEADALVTPHEIYLGLGLTAARRQAAYRELFRSELEPRLLDQIRQASNGNFALGSARFADEIATALGRRVTPGQSGRPRKPPEPESGELFA